jgi:uncharacterized protein (DUF1800 family)
VSLSLSPEAAWQPLPAGEWNRETAQHLLRRAGWAAPPYLVERAVSDGLPATLDRLFPAQPARWPEPASVAQFEQSRLGRYQRVSQAPPEEKRLLQKEERERAEASIQDMSIRWLQFASQPENSAFAKWILMLGDVYVVASDKVKNPSFLYRHSDILARGALGRAPDLSKAVSRSPAMVMYLDLNENRRGAPNENFARELFELFLLGEGNYTEKDIKEAARAFTGYRVRPAVGDFFYARKQHDDGLKTIFGQTGAFTGDDVIDLAYGLPAAEVRLPRKLGYTYLSNAALPPEYLRTLGGRWRAESGFDLRWLALQFFGSGLFFAPEFRANFIKSPVQFYLGLVQDLDLDPIPLPRYVLSPMRQMGQVLFNPPNVRGWLGGRNWITSSSLDARRNVVEMLFAPINLEALNADEQRELAAASALTGANFTVGDDLLAPLSALAPLAAVGRLVGDFLPIPPRSEFVRSLGTFIAEGASPQARQLRERRAAATVLESPEYQLC